MRNRDIVAWLSYHSGCTDAMDAADSTGSVGGTFASSNDGGIVWSDRDLESVDRSDVAAIVVREEGQVAAPTVPYL